MRSVVNDCDRAECGLALPPPPPPPVVHAVQLDQIDNRYNSRTMCCALCALLCCWPCGCGLIGLLYSLCGYADHRVGDYVAYRHKLKRAKVLCGTGNCLRFADNRGLTCVPGFCEQNSYQQSDGLDFHIKSYHLFEWNTRREQTLLIGQNGTHNGFNSILLCCIHDYSNYTKISGDRRRISRNNKSSMPKLRLLAGNRTKHRTCNHLHRGGAPRNTTSTLATLSTKWKTYLSKQAEKDCPLLETLKTVSLQAQRPVVMNLPSLA